MTATVSYHDWLSHALHSPPIAIRTRYSSMNEDHQNGEASPPGARFSIATLMELTAACAVAASLGWMIGPVASFMLMIAACGIVFKQGWIVLVSVIVLIGMVAAYFVNPTRELDYVPVGLSLVFIGVFAWYRAISRRQALRQLTEMEDSGSQETEKGHSP